MAKRIKSQPPRTWRPNPEDQKLIAELQQKFGVAEPDILRMGIRALAEKEGIKQ